MIKEELDNLKYYSLADIEPVIGVSHRTLLRYIKDGKLKAVKLGGRWKVSAAELERFLQGENGNV